ncbi:siroheme decarboxylase subunit alpha [Halodesulfovibrio sp.]|jgi:DNA-binding Lrp family transcriptional regulator|uniref:siroheme decarboxylase subunit alpha n=1 Tax=Halodesulfovibrio sp. TaxID=1912772 RepID=UPI0025EE5CD2|nr:siroheme decarboxylase subunit alpha [Halodesulfovibrio sp.]MCT4535465.1 siroheme decarboxylase subunit alpha [Halodesulfovibrio sp.]MCT4626278.1 siroheme decarboxylase subunit alpha [Halodesulfovibrio sp.]
MDKQLESALSSTDRKVLTIIQSGFPIAPRPYEVIGEQVGLTEAEALATVRSLKERKIIRRLGANFNSKGLGWRSTLCAAKVPEEKVEEFVAEVNSHAGVTHNYLRDHEFNIWFTFIGPNWDAVVDTLNGITEKTGIEILNLPATALYKIKVDFNLVDK